jgi:ubiquinone/menaquinone biosynthesis C-methylase UbiE
MKSFSVYLVKTMKGKSRVDSVEVKKANIRHHDVEAEFFERVHPEGSSVYERAKVSKSIAFIAERSDVRDLAVDVGCGTGFVTSFELPLYRSVVATDISRRMLEVVEKRFGYVNSLNLVVCDAEYLPLKSEIADLVSVSSVLHHLPKPFSSIKETSRILKKDGFLYITREPSFQRLRRFFDFFDYFLVQKLSKLAKQFFAGVELCEPHVSVKGLDYAKVDVHYSTGFHVAQLSEVLVSSCFEVVFAYSYHWIYPDSDKGWLQQLLTRSNFVVEKIPLSNRLGRYVSVIARKRA